MATWVNRIQARTVISVQSSNETQPPPLTTDGLDIGSVAAFALHVSCDNGQTFNNSASVLQAWRYSPFTGRWSRAADSDVTVGSAGVGLQDIVTSFQIAAPRGGGRIAHLAYNVGVTGGGLTLTYECSQLSGLDC